jgi:hypothetical protein
MMQQYSSYQLRALQQLADFRNIFYDEGKTVRTDLLNRSISFFVELFCQNHFADSDYTTIQKKPKQFLTADEWINEFDIDTILKFLTYYIWTNKSHDGYFVRKIKDKTVHKFLVRLNEILLEENKETKIQNTNVFILNSSLPQSNYKN